VILKIEPSKILTSIYTGFMTETIYSPQFKLKETKNSLAFNVLMKSISEHYRTRI